MIYLSLSFGIAVGFSLGLTGGGGSIIAVPLLVYGLGVAPHQAVGISLAAVGAIAATGVLQRLRSGLIEYRVGLLFAAAGMIGAPIGSRLGQRIPAELLLLSFAVLMLLVGLRMWRRAVSSPEDAGVVRAGSDESTEDSGPACRQDPTGRLRMTGRCTIVMSIVGLLTGILSGMYGVGGGFIIVPALMFFTSLSIRQAVATSLLTIALISGAGVVSILSSDLPVLWDVAGLFVVGGTVGMGCGILLSRHISVIQLQKLFALAIVLLATFVIYRNWP